LERGTFCLLPFAFFLLTLAPLSRFEPGTFFLCAPPATACARITDNLLCFPSFFVGAESLILGAQAVSLRRLRAPPRPQERRPAGSRSAEFNEAGCAGWIVSATAGLVPAER